MPHQALWVTCGAAGGAGLFLSWEHQSSAAKASLGEQAALLSAGAALPHRAVPVSLGQFPSLLLNFFPKDFGNSRCMFMLFMCNL